VWEIDDFWGITERIREGKIKEGNGAPLSFEV